VGFSATLAAGVIILYGSVGHAGATGAAAGQPGPVAGNALKNGPTVAHPRASGVHSEAPEPGDGPEAAETPEASGKPEPSETPEAGEAAGHHQGGQHGHADGKPEPSEAPEPAGPNGGESD
jgi:hypothetical protein